MILIVWILTWTDQCFAYNFEQGPSPICFLSSIYLFIIILFIIIFFCSLKNLMLKASNGELFLALETSSIFNKQ